ncbi:MAG: hypothetical protein WD227_10545 [Vicinamibacterales bacterium]
MRDRRRGGQEAEDNEQGDALHGIPYLGLILPAKAGSHELQVRLSTEHSTAHRALRTGTEHPSTGHPEVSDLGI